MQASPPGDRSAQPSPKARSRRWIGFLIALLLIGGFWGVIEGWVPASWLRTKADLESSVVQNMQHTFETELAPKGLVLRVERVTLVHSGGNQYNGMATISHGQATADIPVDVEADNDHIMYRLDQPALLALTLKGSTAAPVVPPDRQPQSSQAEQQVPYHPADAAMPVADGAAPVAPTPAIPSYDVEKYCRSVAGSTGGSSQIELGCRQQEIEAQSWMRGHSTTDRIANYCNQVASAVGGTYQIFKGCVIQEEGAAAKL